MIGNVSAPSKYVIMVIGRNAHVSLDGVEHEAYVIAASEWFA